MLPFSSPNSKSENLREASERADKFDPHRRDLWDPVKIHKWRPCCTIVPKNRRQWAHEEAASTTGNETTWQSADFVDRVFLLSVWFLRVHRVLEWNRHRNPFSCAV